MQHGTNNRQPLPVLAVSRFRIALPYLFLSLTAGLYTVPVSQADAPKAPPAAAQVRVVLRYRIVAARDEHVAAYDAMIRHLRSLGYQFQPPLEQHADTDREDPNRSYLMGAIASDKLVRLLTNPSIASVLAVPEDFVYPPNELDKIARVRLELSAGLSPDRQRELAEQVKAVLTALGFREAPAYDHHGHSGQAFTRLVGTIPQGRLEVLLKDLRGQPAGWFAARIPPQELPTPLRNVNPIRIVEVLTDPEAIVTPAGPQPRSPAFLEKLSPELWSLVSAKSHDAGTARIELILTGPDSLDQGWTPLLQEAAPGIFIEGRLGQVVSAVVRLRQVPALAALPPVVTLRLQRPAHVDVDPALNLAGDNAKALALTGLDNLHRRGFRGQGVRLAILDTDFRGWAGFKKLGKLPPNTRLLDLTAELDSDLHGAPPAGDPDHPGHGTLCATAAALAAPLADLMLIRTDASSPYQVDELVRYIRGEAQSSAYLDRRRDELVTARAELNLLSSIVQRERRVILESYIDETDLEKDFGFLGPAYGWVFGPRTWSRAQVAYVQKLNHELTQRDRRYFDLIDGIRSLGGVTLIASPLVWNDGVAVGGASPLSRAFDRYFQPPLPTPTRAAKSPLFWFQAAGNTRGQSWAGLYQDQDGNGIMEFAGPGYRLKKGQWTTELNFLAWQPFAGPPSTHLPEGARLHLSLQWREPHDPDYYASLGGADLYAKPLANLKVSLLRQRDPDGKTLAADSFDLVAATFGAPQRLEHQRDGSIYEAVLEVTLDKAGRYAVQIERPTGQKWVLVEDPGGKRPAFARLQAEVPSGLRPAGVVTLPALEKHWELQPRLFVDVLGAERRAGRPVFAGFATDQGSVGSPGDGRSVITVGAANWQNQPEPYSAGGPLAYAELAAKPTLLAYARLQLGPPGTAGSAFGSSIAASFAAGTTAALISAGMSPEAAWRFLNQHSGRVLTVPWK